MPIIDADDVRCRLIADDYAHTRRRRLLMLSAQRDPSIAHRVVYARRRAIMLRDIMITC